jgi:hypothetical protein
MMKKERVKKNWINLSTHPSSSRSVNWSTMLSGIKKKSTLIQEKFIGEPAPLSQIVLALRQQDMFL